MTTCTFTQHCSLQERDYWRFFCTTALRLNGFVELTMCRGFEFPFGDKFNNSHLILTPSLILLYCPALKVHMIFCSVVAMLFLLDLNVFSCYNRMYNSLVFCPFVTLLFLVAFMSMNGQMLSRSYFIPLSWWYCPKQFLVKVS